MCVCVCISVASECGGCLWDVGVGVTFIIVVVSMSASMPRVLSTLRVFLCVRVCVHFERYHKSSCIDSIKTRPSISTTMIKRCIPIYSLVLSPPRRRRRPLPPTRESRVVSWVRCGKDSSSIEQTNHDTAVALPRDRSNKRLTGTSVVPGLRPTGYRCFRDELPS